MISKRHSIICVSKKMMIYALPGYGREPARLGLAGCPSTVSMMPVTGARCELPRTPSRRSSQNSPSRHFGEEKRREGTGLLATLALETDGPLAWGGRVTLPTECDVYDHGYRCPTSDTS